VVSTHTGETMRKWKLLLIILGLATVGTAHAGVKGAFVLKGHCEASPFPCDTVILTVFDDHHAMIQFAETGSRYVLGLEGHRGEPEGSHVTFHLDQVLLGSEKPASYAGQCTFSYSDPALSELLEINCTVPGGLATFKVDSITEVSQNNDDQEWVNTVNRILANSCTSGSKRACDIRAEAAGAEHAIHTQEFLTDVCRMGTTEYPLTEDDEKTACAARDALTQELKDEGYRWDNDEKEWVKP
jgi:hypothetical protein